MLIHSSLIFLMCISKCINALPLDPIAPESPQEDGLEVPSHLLEMEHKGRADENLRKIVQKVFTSKTVGALDEIVSSVVGLAGGVVEDFGDIMVETIDQLPGTIRVVSDLVGKAVDDKREKALILVRGIKLDDEFEKVNNLTTEKLAEAVDNSRVRSSLGKLEESFASLIGKFIGVTYKNADNINSAISDGFRRITGRRKDQIADDRLDLVKVIEAGNDERKIARRKVINFLRNEFKNSDNEVKQNKS